MTHEASKKEKTRQISLFAQRRMHDLEIEISEKMVELKTWQAVMEVIKPCGRCGGAGEMRVRVAQDETEMQECEKCKGKGVLA